MRVLEPPVLVVGVTVDQAHWQARYEVDGITFRLDDTHLVHLEVGEGHLEPRVTHFGTTEHVAVHHRSTMRLEVVRGQDRQGSTQRVTGETDPRGRLQYAVERLAHAQVRTLEAVVDATASIAQPTVDAPYHHVGQMIPPLRDFRTTKGHDMMVLRVLVHHEQRFRAPVPFHVHQRVRFAEVRGRHHHRHVRILVGNVHERSEYGRLLHRLR